MKNLNISPLFLTVWKRNLIVYRRIWKVNFLVPLFEPLFYLAAFGVGLSGLIGDVVYAETEMSYIRFIAPALLATAIMFNSFFETTYTSFVRMYYQKTFDAMLATPLSLEEVITAEIFWGATKSMLAATVILLVISVFGFVTYPMGLLIIPMAFFGGLAFGAIGMCFTGVIPTIDMFNLPVFLFVTPLFLFSGTFFPVSALPDWGQSMAVFSPLYHLVEMTRLLTMGLIESNPLLSLTYLAIFALIFYFLSIILMRRRLIK